MISFNVFKNGKLLSSDTSKDFIKTRIALWEAKTWFVELIDTLVVYIAQKLELQARAGADVLMIFDSCLFVFNIF